MILNGGEQQQPETVDADPKTVNPTLVRLLEQTLREAKEGKWQGGGVIKVSLNGQVDHQAAGFSPFGNFLIMGGCFSLMDKLRALSFQPKEPTIVPASQMPGG